MNKIHKITLGILILVLLSFVASTAEAAISSSLSLGSKNSQVSELQQALKTLGFYTGPVTGFFGPMTKVAVIKFQVANKISPSYGYFGQISIAKLSQLLQKSGGVSSANKNTPPQVAISACSGKAVGASCSYTDNGSAVSGMCDDKPGVIACRKDDTAKGSTTSTTVTVQPTNTTTTTGNQSSYSITQAMSDNAQLSTISFSGLAFITGSAGADTFFPPGKVADFFGFQYMRDVDTAGYGHNTTFLSRVANNVLYILNDTQKAKLVALAKTQASLYTNFSYNRFPIMNAFRRNLEGSGPTGSSGLSSSVVSAYTANLYKTDADLSYNRALVVGEIINSFTDDQKAYLAKMKFDDYSSWPDVSENDTLKKGLTNTEFVAVMTYASELFSWYKGSLTADVYFCPERHGTYFGGFFMKDYPAMNNPSYFISTAITGDSGQGFLDVLTTDQRALITGIISEQKDALTEIAQIRTTVSTELRKAMSGGTVDKEKVYALIERYGALDGQMSALYASRFAAVNRTLTDTQRAALVKLRNLTVVPTGAYMFATPVATPEIPSTDFMFGVGTMPSTAGQTTAPSSFGSSN
ncbi:MAG: peptidoglycan-binding protein [bacterium]